MPAFRVDKFSEYEYRIPLFGPNYSNTRIVRIIREKNVSCCTKTLSAQEILNLCLEHVSFKAQDYEAKGNNSEHLS